MSTLRAHFRVVVEGVKYDVTTNARDLALVQTVTAAQEELGEEGEEKTDGFGGFRLVYFALRREEKYAGTFDEYLDGLDEFDRIEDEQLPEGADDLDPTQQAVSASGP